METAGPQTPPFTNTRDAFGSLNQPAIFGLSILAGIIAGLGAVLFRDLIGILHNLFFLGSLSPSFDANVHTPAGPWDLS